MEDKENREWKIKKIGYGGQRKSGVEDKENWVWRTKKMGIGSRREMHPEQSDKPPCVSIQIHFDVRCQVNLKLKCYDERSLRR